MSESTKGIGQHRSDGTGAPNSGIKTVHRDPEMGKGKAVPASSPSADIDTAVGEEK
jgi:hypothetical protein